MFIVLLYKLNVLHHNMCILYSSDTYNWINWIVTVENVNMYKPLSYDSHVGFSVTHLKRIMQKFPMSSKFHSNIQCTRSLLSVSAVISFKGNRCWLPWWFWLSWWFIQYSIFPWYLKNCWYILGMRLHKLSLYLRLHNSSISRSTEKLNLFLVNKLRDF